MIDKIVCLGLDKRKNLWPSLETQIKKYFNKKLDIFIAGNGDDLSIRYNHIDIDYQGEPFVYGTEKTIKSHFNAYLCHKKIAYEAYTENINKLLFLEDDSYLINSRFEKIFFSDKMHKFLQRSDWDVLYLGWWQTKTDGVSEDREDLEEKWKKNEDFGIDIVERPPKMKQEICGLHGIIFNKNFIPIIANAPYGPIDSFLNRNLDNIRAYYVWPKIIHIHSTWSYCEQGFFKRQEIQ